MKKFQYPQVLHKWIVGGKKLKSEKYDNDIWTEVRVILNAPVISFEKMKLIMNFSLKSGYRFFDMDVSL